MPKTKPGKSSPPPSAHAIERRAWALRSHTIDARQELAEMSLDRLQRAILTPGIIDSTHGEPGEVFKACLLLKRYHSDEAGRLHRRLSQAIARRLWEYGTVDALEVRVLNALAAFLEYAANDFRSGWDNWTGGTK